MIRDFYLIPENAFSQMLTLKREPYSSVNWITCPANCENCLCDLKRVLQGTVAVSTSSARQRKATSNPLIKEKKAVEAVGCCQLFWIYARGTAAEKAPFLNPVAKIQEMNAIDRRNLIIQEENNINISK